jgi:uncharacterized protein YndB with AHSA1/START domain
MTTKHDQTTPRFQSTPEKAYKAFLDPEAMVKWLPPNGFTGKVDHVDARVGGTYKMSFTNFGKGLAHSFGGEYLELIPNEKIVHTDKFDDPNLPGEMTAYHYLQKGRRWHRGQHRPGGRSRCDSGRGVFILGWQESLALLALLVEADIPAE